MTKQEIKKLDNLVMQKCKEEADFRCELCGRGREYVQLHGHHVLGRRFRSTRWVLENMVCLCASHHTMGLWSAHENPAWFLREIRDARGEEWYNKLMRLSNHINKFDFKTNKEMMAWNLDEILEKYSQTLQ